MTVGFEPRNLEAAVSTIVREATNQGQDQLIDAPHRVNLKEPEEVKSYLIRQVLAEYTKSLKDATGVQIARIEGIPYRGIGFVFEANDQNQISPNAIPAEQAKEIQHVAYFWMHL